MLPSAPGGYYGLWPDDWYFPNRLVPELLPKDEAHKLFGGELGRQCLTLAALYDADLDAATCLLEEMLAALEKSDYAEWESADGRHFGARKFMMSAAMPLAAVEAILSGCPLLDWF